MAITSVGVGSGLDLESLITNILEAERAPVKNRLDLREAQVTSTISALGSLKSTLADFQGALAKLKDSSSFNTRSATSSDSQLFTATSDKGAELGGYDIQVLGLAKTHKLASMNFATADAKVGTGKLDIAVGGKSFSVELKEGENDSLAGLRDAINQASGNKDVRASLLTVSDGNGGSATKLVLTSAKSGAEGAISITAADDTAGDGNDLARFAFSADAAGSMTETSPAADARITIDGFEVTSNTNTFSKALQGVSLTLLKEPTEDETLTGTLTVGANKSGIKSAVEGFVASYNSLMGIINQLTDVKEGGKRPLLSGDSTVSMIESRLRGVLGGNVVGAAADFNSLAFLGVSTNRDGTISLDSDTLTAALDSRYEEVGTLFAGDNGVAGRLDKLVGDLLKSDGMFATREESLDKQLDAIDAQRESFSLRLEKIEARYRAQFSALDIMVSQLNTTGDFLQQQLAATASLINRDRK